MQVSEPATTAPQENRILAFPSQVGDTKFSPNADPGPAWPEKVRLKIGEVYGPVVAWIQGRINISEDEAQDALHEVLSGLGPRQVCRVTQWERYLTRATVRRYRRSKAKHPGKLKLLLFSELSKEDRESLFAIRAPGPTPDEEVAEWELLDIMRKEVEKLPTRQRQVLTLELDGKKPEEIQAILGLRKVSTVSSNRKKAIGKLRRIPAFREDE